MIFTTQTISYTYDKLNQLTSVSNYGNLGLKDVYQYDNRGNITRKDCYNASSNALNGYSIYQYDTARLDQLSNYTLYDSAGAVVSTRDYTYDGAGNPTRIADSANGTTSLSWTQGKKLQSISAPGVNNTYCYNESGLVFKLTKSDGSTIEYYYDDEQLEIEEYRDSSGSVVRLHKYFYDDDGVVRFIETKNNYFGDSSRYFLYAYIYDGTGTITDLVRVHRPGVEFSSFEPAVHYEYDAYGKILSETNLLDNGENISLFNPIKYKGYYYENIIKMYRLDSRYYDPQIARFLNADNLGLLTESLTALTDKNLYNYCDNNPVNRKDAEGEIWNVLVGAGFGAVAGAAIEMISQAVASGGKVTDWGAVAKSALGGAVSGGMAASGLGIGWQIATNAAVNMGTEVAKNGIKGNRDSIVAAGVVGAVAGFAGGKGVGGPVKRMVKEPLKRPARVLLKKGDKWGYKLKKAGRIFRTKMRQTKKHSRYIFRGIRKDGYWLGYIKSNAVNGSYSIYTSHRKR